jgi:hypothetical protein
MSGGGWRVVLRGPGGVTSVTRRVRLGAFDAARQWCRMGPARSGRVVRTASFTTVLTVESDNDGNVTEREGE